MLYLQGIFFPGSLPGFIFQSNLGYKSLFSLAKGLFNEVTV